MSIEKDRDRLSQAKMLEGLRSEPPLTELLTVYFSGREYPSNHGLHCALIQDNRIRRVLAQPDWDLRHGGGVPTTVTYLRGRREQVEYLRFGSTEGVEPLVLERLFHGLRVSHLEISEEFRLFHNLFHDRKSDAYFKIDDAGKEHLVAVITADRVQIRLKEIRQFLAVKEMYLSIQFDCKEFSKHSLTDLGFEKGGGDHREARLCWGLHYGESSLDIDGYSAWSHLLGKRLIGPLPKSKSGLPAFAKTPARGRIRDRSHT